jgi:hypothetical protein
MDQLNESKNQLVDTLKQQHGVDQACIAHVLQVGQAIWQVKKTFESAVGGTSENDGEWTRFLQEACCEAGVPSIGPRMANNYIRLHSHRTKLLESIKREPIADPSFRKLRERLSLVLGEMRQAQSTIAEQHLGRAKRLADAAKKVDNPVVARRLSIDAERIQASSREIDALLARPDFERVPNRMRLAFKRLLSETENEHHAGIISAVNYMLSGVFHGACTLTRRPLLHAVNYYLALTLKVTRTKSGFEIPFEDRGRLQRYLDLGAKFEVGLEKYLFSAPMVAPYVPLFNSDRDAFGAKMQVGRVDQQAS